MVGSTLSVCNAWRNQVHRPIFGRIHDRTPDFPDFGGGPREGDAHTVPTDECVVVLSDVAALCFPYHLLCKWFII